MAEPATHTTFSSIDVLGVDFRGSALSDSGLYINGTALSLALVVEIPDISTAGDFYVVSPWAGTVSKVYSVINGAIATANAALTTKINGSAITGGGITVAFSGSAAGDVDSATPSAANTVAAGDALEVETDGASTNAVRCTVVFEITLT